MASTYKENGSNINISSGVKAKLQKWMGKANANVRDKRVGKEITAETTDYESSKIKVTNTLSPEHSRSRSTPIPMPGTEKKLKKLRRGSVNFPPTKTLKEDIVRENDKNDSYPENGIQQGFITHSVRLHESSSAPTSVQLKRQHAFDKCVEKTTLEDQTCCVGVKTTDRTDEPLINVMNGYRITQEVPGSRVRTKRNVLSRTRSKTSVDLSGQHESPENGRMFSAVSLDSIPNNAQELSGQIQSRLQIWVKRASHLATVRGRRQSEESASSTDDSTNTPDSPRSLTPGSESESQVKKIKELELALKELVENVGVRGQSCPSKLQDACSNSPSSSSRNRSRNNSERHGSDRQRNGEFNGNEKDGGMENVSRDAQQSTSQKSRNNSSSSADSDTVIKVTDVFDTRQNENDQVDLDDVIFMKASYPTRDQPNFSPRERKSVSERNLQDVLISETLIEEIPIPEDSDNAKKTTPKNHVKKQRDETTLQQRVTEEYSPEVADNKNRLGKTVSTEEHIENGNSVKTVYESNLSSKNGTASKLDRPRVKRRAMSTDANSLKACSKLGVRESMRQYLKFKDADLSAFAVECVRHANKKKQIVREEGDQATPGEQDAEHTIPVKKAVNIEDTQAVGAMEQKPVVVISSEDNDKQTDMANGLSEAPKLEFARSSGSPLDNETTEEIIQNEISSNNVFARTAEEADWYEKEQVLAPMPKRKESLERSSSNPPQEDSSTSQRLYKFPSMPMFYIPSGNEVSDVRKQQIKEKRKSATSFPHALNELVNTGSDPFYHGDTRSRTRVKSVSSISSSNLSSRDENGNETFGKPKSSPRPKLKGRKFSAPARSHLFSLPSKIQVDIEAHI